MDSFVYNKIKTTSQLFFERRETAVKMDSTELHLTVLPYLSYSGHYFLNSIHKSTFAYTVYKAERGAIGSCDDWFVYITKSADKIMIYNAKNEGIILKQ